MWLKRTSLQRVDLFPEKPIVVFEHVIFRFSNVRFPLAFFSANRSTAGFPTGGTST